jgi:hypothetical protein
MLAYTPFLMFSFGSLNNFRIPTVNYDLSFKLCFSSHKGHQIYMICGCKVLIKGPYQKVYEKTILWKLKGKNKW